MVGRNYKILTNWQAACGYISGIFVDTVKIIGFVLSRNSSKDFFRIEKKVFIYVTWSFSILKKILTNCMVWMNIFFFWTSWGPPYKKTGYCRIMQTLICIKKTDKNIANFFYTYCLVTVSGSLKKELVLEGGGRYVFHTCNMFL